MPIQGQTAPCQCFRLRCRTCQVHASGKGQASTPLKRAGHSFKKSRRYAATGTAGDHVAHYRASGRYIAGATRSPTVSGRWTKVFCLQSLNPGVHFGRYSTTAVKFWAQIASSEIPVQGRRESSDQDGAARLRVASRISLALPRAESPAPAQERRPVPSDWPRNERPGGTAGELPKLRRNCSGLPQPAQWNNPHLLVAPCRRQVICRRWGGGWGRLSLHRGVALKWLPVPQHWRSSSDRRQAVDADRWLGGHARRIFQLARRGRNRGLPGADIVPVTPYR